jgi:putative NIF3 family GTP cyclohydrolase 1 type 2
MRLDDCVKFLRDLLGPSASTPGEFGVTCRGREEILSLGYAVNLTPETVEAAAREHVDLLLTHHDAWDFLFGMKDALVEALRRHGIGHLYAHLPLDAADFGTAAALGELLGGRVTGRVALYEGYHCGRICALDGPVDLAGFVRRLETACGEKVQTWRNSDRPIRTFAVLTGGGHLTDYVKECADLGCDLFLTGEKTLYTVEYARFRRIHLVVGSHTFTEIFGVEALAGRIAERFLEVRSIRLGEPHLETGGT